MPKIKTEISQHVADVCSRRVFSNTFLRQRELGIHFPMGHNDQFHKTLYSSTTPITSWDISKPEVEDGPSVSPHGAVFNLEYAPDG